jgi:hypothetical protein
MKTKRITLILIFSIVAFLSEGQDFTFKVLASKGANEVKSGEDWRPIKPGAGLKSQDELKVVENGYIGLVSSNGMPLELKEAKTYSVAELAANATGGTSVLNKYTDFILSSNSAEAKKNRLSATGAVHRGDASAIKVLLPENQHSGIYNQSAVINWDGSKVQGPYIVKINSMFDEELFKFETSETSIQIDLSDPKLAEETAVLVEISSKANPGQSSKQHLIKKLTPEEQKNVKHSLDEILGQVREQTALNKFILAGFYEENHLFIDAIAAYEEAIKLAPDVPTYQEAYDEFLLRHGMNR